ncbi:DUF2064 domain-containing protein [Photobacterium carnosum]|uniref:DUF2064 domain-containing protein n=1 Tax=Photobacterium carnosum TaxID=2023717 RepID=UPI001E5257AE|nr:DUF2064 domain-containing protein [Photobacterium carnosum]MCD9496779.1 DUF2064 domain-containing protein [Photobacterium carnosum]
MNSAQSNNLSSSQLGQHTQHQATLVIFCKRPKLHQGKQRLVKDSNAKSALNVAQALLACAIEDANNWQGPVVIAYTDHADKQWAQSLTNKAQVIAQLPDGNLDTLRDRTNLGDRINYVDSQLRAQGHQQLIIIGTDAPTLNNEYFQAILHVLKNSDIALSHADDGGVVIMANKTPWPRLTYLPWSTNELSHALFALCKQQQLSVQYSTPGYDVDYITDLQKLAVDLKSDIRPARQVLLQIINKFLLLSEITNHA